jgi:hypothetical protein
MNFLKTLFWVVLAVGLAIFSTLNWDIVVPIKLWADLQADVKLPVLILLIYAAGFLPPYLILRGRIWGLRRKLALAERPTIAPAPPPPASQFVEGEDGT